MQQFTSASAFRSVSVSPNTAAAARTGTIARPAAPVAGTGKASSLVGFLPLLLRALSAPAV